MNSRLGWYVVLFFISSTHVLYSEPTPSKQRALVPIALTMSAVAVGATYGMYKLRRNAPHLLEQLEQRGNGDGLWTCFLRWLCPTKQVRVDTSSKDVITPPIPSPKQSTPPSLIALTKSRNQSVFSPTFIAKALQDERIEELEKEGVFQRMGSCFYASKFDRLVSTLVTRVQVCQLIRFVGRLNAYHQRRFVQACFDANLDETHRRIVSTIFDSVWRKQEGGSSIILLLDINFVRYRAKLRALLPVAQVRDFLETLPVDERQRAYQRLVLVYGYISDVSSCEGVTPLSRKRVKNLKRPISAWCSSNMNIDSGK